MGTLLEDLLGGPPPPADLREVAQAATLGAAAPPFATAVRLGLRAATVSAAFAAGYQAALRALLPSLPAGEVVSLAATEAGGVTPKAILTTVTHDGGFVRLDGVKAFATLAPLAALHLVVARDGGTDERPRLVVAEVPQDAPGLVVTPLPETPFASEVPHAQLVLEGVRLPAAALLPADGWSDVLKPFRTHEDLHVFAGVGAHLVGEARRAGLAEHAARLAALLASIAALAALPVDDPGLHVALGGAIDLARAAADALLPALPPERAAALARDLPLLRVAEGARKVRSVRGWERLRGSAAP